jgi:hypothetical protein
MKILSSFQNRIKNWLGSSKSNNEFEIQFTKQTPKNIIRTKIKENEDIVYQLFEHLSRNINWVNGHFPTMKMSYELPEPSKSFILSKLQPFKDLAEYADSRFLEARDLEWKVYRKNLVNYQERWYNHLISELEQENEILYKALEILERK